MAARAIPRYFAGVCDFMWPGKRNHKVIIYVFEFEFMQTSPRQTSALDCTECYLSMQQWRLVRVMTFQNGTLENDHITSHHFASHHIILHHIIRCNRPRCCAKLLFFVKHIRPELAWRDLCHMSGIINNPNMSPNISIIVHLAAQLSHYRSHA